MPPDLAIVIVTMLVYAFSAEVYLQNGAHAARKKAIEQLTMKIRTERNNNRDENVLKRIEAEIQRIKDLREGAFRPWYEWPLIQSFGGLGTLWVALQYLSKLLGHGDL